MSCKITGLRKLINKCELYAVEYDVKFNGSKSKYMLYIGRECAVFNTDIFVNGDKGEQVISAVHLGHKLSTVMVPLYGICMLMKIFVLAGERTLRFIWGA